MTTMILALAALALAPPPATAAPPDDARTFRVFVLAGQSNMEGHGVVTLDDGDGESPGTLVSLSGDPRTAPLAAAVRDAGGGWRTRDDVLVRYATGRGAVKKGALAPGFTPHGDTRHFGPELALGQVLGDAIDEPVLLVKTAWGGKSLCVDFRPPSSGGETGPFYRRMIDDVRTAIARAGDEFPSLEGRTPVLAGFVWYHGWNDGCDPARAVPEYEDNLVNLVRDVRRDLGAADLPVVIGELTGPWVDAPDEWGALRRAQAAAAARPELRGPDGRMRVAFVPTAAFVRDPGESPHPTHGHHEFGNAETYLLVGDALGRAMRALAVDGAPAFVPTLPPRPGEAPAKGEMSGYMLVPVEPAPERFNAGFSMYAAAWPLLERHPGRRFQTGLFGTWMFAQYARGPDGKHDPADKPKGMYSDIEGGLGWWRDTRFPTATPKFIMGGVAPDFVAWANGPGAGKGRDWSKPLGKYAVAQLSPWVLWPPDGLNLAQGTCGELFGYGYVPLPFVDATSAGPGNPVETGDRCWTLIVNAANFKGPVAFFTPRFWAESKATRPELAGKLLDTRPSDPSKAFQMETQWVPASIGAETPDGAAYARVAPMSFPVDAEGRTVVLHRLTCYAPDALADGVREWFRGGPASSGRLDPAASHVQRFKDGGGSTWRIFAEGSRREDRDEVDWRSFGTPTAHDEHTFGYAWDPNLVRPVAEAADGAPPRRVRLPEHFRLEARPNGAAAWRAVDASSVPAESGLAAVRFATPREPREGPYVTPDAVDGPFRAPGPVAGPFEATLGDGSTVTYAWYRFADQPAMLNAGLTAAEREEAQRRVELVHRAWTKDREYIAPPTTGTLASIDPALLVTPPKGLETGHVPVVTRQERRPRTAPRERATDAGRAASPR